MVRGSAALLLATGLLACATRIASPPSPSFRVESSEPPGTTADTLEALPRVTLGEVRGVVRDKHSAEPLREVFLSLDCTCLPDSLYAITDSAGLYRFRELPAGKYTLQILHTPRALATRIAYLPLGFAWRADFRVKIPRFDDTPASYDWP